jgi:hypothetical protein
MKKKQRRALGRPHRLALAKQVVSDQQTERVAIIDRQKPAPKEHIVRFRVAENKLRKFFELMEAAETQSGGGMQFISAIREDLL